MGDKSQQDKGKTEEHKVQADAEQSSAKESQPQADKTNKKKPDSSQPKSEGTQQDSTPDTEADKVEVMSLPGQFSSFINGMKVVHKAYQQGQEQGQEAVSKLEDVWQYFLVQEDELLPKLCAVKTEKECLDLLNGYKQDVQQFVYNRIENTKQQSSTGSHKLNIDDLHAVCSLLHTGLSDNDPLLLKKLEVRFHPAWTRWADDNQELIAQLLACKGEKQMRAWEKKHAKVIQAYLDDYQDDVQRQQQEEADRKNPDKPSNEEVVAFLRELYEHKDGNLEDLEARSSSAVLSFITTEQGGKLAEQVLSCENEQSLEIVLAAVPDMGEEPDPEQLGSDQEEALSGILAAIEVAPFIGTLREIYSVRQDASKQQELLAAMDMHELEYLQAPDGQLFIHELLSCEDGEALELLLTKLTNKILLCKQNKQKVVLPADRQEKLFKVLRDIYALREDDTKIADYMAKVEPGVLQYLRDHEELIASVLQMQSVSELDAFISQQQKCFADAETIAKVEQKPITKAEINWLKKSWAYVIVAAQEEEKDLEKINLERVMQAPSGLKLLYTPGSDATPATLAFSLMGRVQEATDSVDGGSTAVGLDALGMSTAAALLNAGTVLGFREGVKIVAGSQQLKHNLWAVASVNELDVKGFSPTKKEQAWLEKRKAQFKFLYALKPANKATEYIATMRPGMGSASPQDSTSDEAS